jgi:hypothetical protein
MISTVAVALALALFQATGAQSPSPRPTQKTEQVSPPPVAETNRADDSKSVNADRNADRKDRVERPKPAVKFEEDVFAGQDRGAASKVKGGFAKIGRAIRSAAGAVGDFLVGEY